MLPCDSLHEGKVLTETEDNVMGYLLEIQDIHKTFNPGTINEKVALLDNRRE